MKTTTGVTAAARAAGIALAGWGVAGAGAAFGQSDDAAVPEPVTNFMGREIAQTMHWRGAGWLVRAEREREENAERMLSELRLEPGMTVCDIGSGNGFHALRMARMVGEGGRVIAVDIQREMLRMLQARAAGEGIGNIETVEGLPHDPQLPEGVADVILLVDVYHEFSHPEPMLRAMRETLKPTGVMALVEFRAEDEWVPIKPLHKMSKAQMMKEIPANGFKLVRSFENLPWQHMMFFARDDSPLPPPDGLSLASVDFPPPDELPERPELPELLVCRDGERVTTPELWRSKRRPELAALVDHYIYGKMPPPPVDVRCETVAQDASWSDGLATKKRVRISFGPEGVPPIDLLLFVPNAASARPAPVFLGMNFRGNHTVVSDPDIPLARGWVPNQDGAEDNQASEASRGSQAARWPVREIIARGYAVATFYHGDADPDRDDFSDGLHPHFRPVGAPERTPDSWGALAAWAYGIHRAVDCLTQDPSIDSDRIAVMGFSRNGKAALVAGATDERIALVVSNQSGCGGAALSRRRVGETVKDINSNFPHWFALNFRAFNENEDKLPVDQHAVISLIAPRPVLVCSAEEDKWADPEGEFLAAKAASPVFRLLGTDGLAVDKMPAPGDPLVDSRVGYHIRPGPHATTIEDWNVFLDFADAQWKE